ncbi:MAG: YggS family pyridoxal phosphate-dependent enzyme [Bacteroidetes bacterium]|nr:YggS family pyridoxal phosphate-dependent enzyme [Bacteroidota bacterium]MBU1718592.1 YggS family pyridoxal phosphate-dependent enzyme [Bacteroidota bacterium]
MGSIQQNINMIKAGLPEGVRLIAVSKNQPVEAVLEAYNGGHRVFGENKAQEAMQKYPQLPDDIEWHFIGHLQTNKVKYITPFVQLIHSVDSEKLLVEINKSAIKNNRVIDCLLQFHIAEEETKFGFSEDEAVQMLRSPEFSALTNIRICGVMGMATFTDDADQISREFTVLKGIFDSLKEKFFARSEVFRELSMGMSDDYRIAIKHGSTLVRVGTAIFGARNYN